MADKDDQYQAVLAGFLFVIILAIAMTLLQLNPDQHPWLQNAGGILALLPVPGWGAFIVYYSMRRNRRFSELAKSMPPVRKGQGIRIGLLIWRIVLVGLVLQTCLYSYLTAEATVSRRCVGLDWIAGWRSNLSDFIALPLISILALIAFFSRLRLKWTRQILTIYSSPIFELGSISTAPDRDALGLFALSNVSFCSLLKLPLGTMR